ncbi:MAG: 9-O-acetylesterase [Muribaculaceae bacterium]|nr:9-O-acetylesterase [Muribaculaceae bacterium]
MKKLPVLLTAITVATSLTVSAKVVLPNYITDNMLVQRNSVMRIAGDATPGSEVNIKASWDAKAKKVKADKAGKFEADIHTPEAGGPYTIEISDKDSKVKVGNVLSGELWLCSGQSNMEFPVQGWTSVMDADHVVSTARNPDIRLFQVKKNTSFTPQNNLEANMGGWVEAAPNTMDFSAIAYLYARELRDSLQIPVGVIDATWGGTPAEAWTSVGYLKGVPGFEGELAAMERCGYDRTRLKANYEKELEDWMAMAKKDKSSVKPGVLSKGTTMRADYFERLGFGNEFDGIVWAQKEIDVPVELAGKPMRLSLSAIDDEDVTYLNGTEVARGSGFNVPREYTIDGKYVKAGKNIISIRISDFGGEGGFSGPADLMKAEIDGTVIPLGDGWVYTVGVNFADLPQKPVSVESSSYPSVLYNAMIHPLRNLPVKGVLWYQGCANVGRADQYEPLFKSLINNWRDTWNAELPFYFVQLAGWLKPQAVQPESEWAALRNAQSKALELPNTAMVSAIDLGDPGDIHPRDKQSIAHRLALTSLNRDYGLGTDYKAPVCTGSQIKGDKVILTFDAPVTATSSAMLGFIVGDKEGNFEQAVVKTVNPQTLELTASGISRPVCVRYDWADFPNGNVYGLNGIPLAPFATDK